MRRLLMLSMVVLAASSDGAEPKRVSAKEEIARLEKEIAAQHALLLRLIELQNQCAAQMLRAVNGLPEEDRCAERPVVTSPPPPVEPGAGPVKSNQGGGKPPPPPPPAPRFARLTGRVHVTNGGPAWVFVEDVKGPAPTAAQEIKQEDKQFSPRIIAVPSGTRVSFPNFDVVYHNVFSHSAAEPFDLGMLRAGDPVKSKVLSRPGVVEIFCNIHARMSATVLVTPGPLLARVGPDGSFTIDNVPTGTHQVSAWAGGQVFATKAVEVGPSGGTAEFQIGAAPTGPHLNKLGQPYGSYED